MKRFRRTGVFSFFIILFMSACIDLEPDTATNPVGREHRITAFVDEAMGPVPGALVTFEVISGPNAGRVSVPDSGECFPNSCRTNIIGTVSWVYTSSTPGTDMIAASFLDNNGLPVESEPVEAIWSSSIPALSEWGLIALAGVLGIISILAVRRRNSIA